MAPEGNEVRQKVEDAHRIVEALAALDKAGVLGRHDAPKAETLQRLFTGRTEVPLAELLRAIWPDATNEDAALNLYRGFKARLNERLAKKGLGVFLCSPQDNRPVASKTVWFEGIPSAAELARRREDEEARNSAEIIQREHKREFLGTPSVEYIPQEVTSGLRAVRFPETVAGFAERFAPKAWGALPQDDRAFLANLMTKLEPIVQLVPATKEPLVVAFECLGLGPGGQSFPEIEARFRDRVDPGLLRVLMALCSVETASTLACATHTMSKSDPRQLLFTVNLDPQMLVSAFFDEFLHAYRDKWQCNVVFELHQEMVRTHIDGIKRLVAEFGLGFCLDDINELDPQVRENLADLAILSKVDARAFLHLMAGRDDPETTVRELASYRLANRPLLVEGVEDDNFVSFLQRHWRHQDNGTLLAQGYLFTPGLSWEGWIADLRHFGLRGGHFLASHCLAEAKRTIGDFLSAQHRGELHCENRGIIFSIRVPGACCGRDRDIVFGILNERASSLPTEDELQGVDFLVVKARLGALDWEQVPMSDLRGVLDASAHATEIGERALIGRLADLYVPQFWVPPNVMPLRQTGTDVDPAEEARQFLLHWVKAPGSPPFCAILGDYGVGKTFLCRMFSRGLLELRDAGDHHLPVPLYLDMRNLPVWYGDRVPRLDEMLRHLLEEAGFGELSTSGVLAAVRRGHVILIFDGFDEHSVHLTDAQATELMRQIRSAAPPHSDGKVLLTCRTHYFLDRANEREKVSGGGGARTREGLRGSAFRIAYLQPFDEKRIRDYLHRVLGDQADAAFEFMKRVHDLVDLAKRPVLLAMIAANLEHLERRARSGERVKAADIYEGVLGNWLGRDTGKHIVFPDLKSDLMAELARRLWLSGGRDATVHFRELRAWILARLKDIFRFGNPEAVWRIDADMRTATFLVRDPRGNYRFAHKSLMEFFLGRGVAIGLSEGHLAALDLPRLNREVLEFAVDLLHGERGHAGRAAQVLTDMLEGAYRTQRSENALLLLLAWRKLIPDTAPRPAELHLEGAQLQGADLAGAQLSGARLLGANLEGAVLTEAKLREADLRGANLKDASARSVDLEGTCLAECRLDQAELTAASLRNCDLSNANGRGAFLQRADCTGARFGRAKFPYARLARAVLLDTQLSEGDFRSSSLPKVAAQGLAFMPFLGHGGWVRCVAFSPDGVIIASGSEDKSVKLWEAGTGCLMRTIEARSREILTVAFGAGGATLASGSSDNSVELWDAATGRLVRTLEGHAAPVNSVAFSPDGATLASGSNDQSVKLWEAATGRLVRTLEGHPNWVNCLAFSPDGAMIASGCAGGSVKLWDAVTGHLVRNLEGHAGSVRSVAFSPDGTALASGSYDKSVKLWEAGTGRLMRTLGLDAASVWSVAFSPNGASLASGCDDNSVKLWEATTGRLVQTMQGHRGWVSSVAFSPDGTTLASGGSDSSVKLWDAATGRLVRTLERYAGTVESVTFSPDGATLASGSDDNSVKLWDAASGCLVRTLEVRIGPVVSVAFSANGTTLTSRGAGEGVRVSDARTGALLRAGREPVPSSVDQRQATSGHLAAAASPAGTIHVYKAGSGELVVTLAAWNPEEWVAWTPDGYFDAPKAAWHRIGVTDGLVSYPVEEFAEHFHRPDIIRERLAKARGE
ncbi:MAG: NACHT domain-containing protein [Planctomycetes bacterium]|nr:NACHT domain-containing protein [Planctomycetota bacterium]